ncbi:MAG: DUF1439 domain-containing protein [Marinomonas sp.]
MKVFQRVLTLAFLVSTLLLSGCNSFLVSEDEVNQEVKKQLEESQQNKITFNIDGNVLNLDLLVTEAGIDFTARDGGLVIVDLVSDLKGTLTAFGQDFSLTTVVRPSFESGVRIEGDKLYLVGPRITKIDVQGSTFSEQMLRSTLGSLHGDLEQALAQHFAKYPVYVLNHSPFEKAAGALVKDIIIKEESLELSIF